LGLTELGRILQLWFPKLKITTSPLPTSMPKNKEADALIRSLIGEIDEINYEIGLKYALGDSKHYIDILTISLKDIHTCMKLVENGYSGKKSDDIKIGVHNIKNVFANIGALTLAELSKDFELTITRSDRPGFELSYTGFMQCVSNFCDKLDTALKKYKSKAKEMTEESKDTFIPMTTEEYEQSICNTIYYIRRFDYVAILNELEKLVRQKHPSYQNELEQAIAEIKEYQYEKILNRMIELKKQMSRNNSSIDEIK
jgi:hypothetical protein